MRKLPLLLILLLLSLLTAAGAAASAHALGLPGPEQVATLAASEDEEETESEDDGEVELETEDDEATAADDEEDASCFGEEDVALCEQQAEEEAEAQECLLEYADASVKASPGNGKVRLTVRYQSFEPTSVSVDARLRGATGGLHLGKDLARFRRAGVYRDTFKLGKRQLAKALVARQFAIDLQAAGTPGYCAVHLTASRAGAKPRWR